MPCNLAVSITKASVTEEKLLALLTPDAVRPVVQSYLSQPGVLKPNEAATVAVQGSRVVVAVGSLQLVVSGGRVTTTATAGYDDTRGRELVDALSTLLALAADALFAQQVRAALSGLGRQVTQQQVTVDNAGVTQAATVLTLRF
jgi:hypothetical protein